MIHEHMCSNTYFVVVMISVVINKLQYYMLQVYQKLKDARCRLLPYPPSSVLSLLRSARYILLISQMTCSCVSRCIYVRGYVIDRLHTG